MGDSFTRGWLKIYYHDTAVDNPVKGLTWANASTDVMESVTGVRDRTVSAVNSSGSGYMGIGAISVTEAEKYRVRFDLVVNSGSAPNRFTFRDDIHNGTFRSNLIQTSQEGKNVMDFVISSTDATAYFDVGCEDITSDFEITNFIIEKIQ